MNGSENQRPAQGADLSFSGLSSQTIRGHSLPAGRTDGAVEYRQKQA
jgi:hypothetical protein